MLNKITLGLLMALAVNSQAQDVLEDPTRPNQQAVNQQATDTGAISPIHNLQAILFSGKKERAIINGKTVSVGDEIGSAVVRVISSSYVVLAQRVDGQWKEQQLRLNKGDKIKTNAADNF